MENKRSTIVGGIILIALGVWFLVEQLGVPLPSLSALWPALLIIFGLASLVGYFTDRNAEKVFFGVAGPLLGAFFFSITLGPLEWSDLRIYWPVFLLIASAGNVAQWLASPSNRGPLSAAAVLLLIGLFFLASNLNLLSRALAQQVLALWPLSLVLLGLIIVVRAFRRA